MSLAVQNNYGKSFGWVKAGPFLFFCFSTLFFLHLFATHSSFVLETNYTHSHTHTHTHPAIHYEDSAPKVLSRAPVEVQEGGRKGYNNNIVLSDQQFCKHQKNIHKNKNKNLNKTQFSIK
jgi:hypothetical protein